MTSQPLFISMILIPFLTAPVVYLIGRTSVRNGQKWGIVLARILTLVSLFVEMVLLVLNVRHAMTIGTVQQSIGLVTLRLDGVGLVIASIVLVLGFLVTIFSIPYMNGERNEEKYYALLLTTIGSIVGLGLSFDLFNLWVWFEAMAISTYFLVAFYNDQKNSLEAGVKYLVQFLLPLDQRISSKSGRAVPRWAHSAILASS
jgi:formate hydrogenlyase subunit 3/multisubunit Na+/H+ antiporter MnhD subunit